MTPENIYYIFNVKPHEAGHIDRVLLGKFLLDNGNFEILEDHGLPKGLASKPPAEAANIIHRYTSSMYYEVVNLQDLVNGLHPELIKDPDTKESMDEDLRTQIGKNASSEPKSTEFEYDRIGAEGPRILSVSDGQVFLDNHLLTQDEIDRVQSHVKEGKAFLRRRMKKAESIFNPGEDPHMKQHLEEDSAIPGVGNLRAYNNFMKAPPPGFHMHINLHDTRAINATYGHQIGNRAIQALGTGLKDTARTLIGPEARVFRLGGDKFSVHVPSTEGAALLARGIRQHLENIPPVKGTHKLSVSIGVGPTKDHAQWALHDSTGERNRRGYPPGQAKTHVSIRIPGGLEGPLPVD
jgi:hypothetical protein